MILVTGFGPFPGVDDNPSAVVARAVDGRTVGGRPVVGLVLPVLWRRGPELAIAAANELGAELVVGLGVATTRDAVDVETIGFRDRDPRPDADGCHPEPVDGPDSVGATLDCAALADGLGARLSQDAGRYVCNAWLYDVARGLPGSRVGFVHMPASGLDPELLLRALERLVG